MANALITVKNILALATVMPIFQSPTESPVEESDQKAKAFLRNLTPIPTPERHAKFVGLQQIYFEAPTAHYSEEKINEIAANYTAFVESCCEVLKKIDKPPKTIAGLTRLWKHIYAQIWTEFSSEGGGVEFLSEAVESKRLDCDTSALICADILRAFDVPSKIVLMKDHALLQIFLGPENPTYLDTSQEFEDSILDQTEFNRRYSTELLSIERIDVAPQAFSYIVSGNHNYNAKQFDKALSDYTKAIELNPNCAAAYYFRSRVYEGLREPFLALEDASKVIRLCPLNIWGYVSHGKIARSFADLETALRDIDKAVHLSPTNAEIVSMRGDLYYGLEQFEKALTDYNSAIALNPKNPDHFVRRALVLESLGKSEEAADDRAKAKALGGE